MMQTAVDDGTDTRAVESGPEGARLHAQEQEEARVTLYRVLHTLCHMMTARGFVVQAIGSVAVSTPDDMATNMERFKSATRAQRAEEVHELLLEAIVPSVPVPWSTAWAAGMPAGTKLVVFVISQGNVDAMRDVQHAAELRGAAIAIIISRKALTAFSKRFLLAASTPALTLQHFKFEELQTAVIRHALVRPHNPLTAAHAATVRKRFANGKLSSLRQSDPVVRFLGLAAGTIVMVREAFGRQQAFTTFFEVKSAQAVTADGGRGGGVGTGSNDFDAVSDIA